jgi:hypothetical protein
MKVLPECLRKQFDPKTADFIDTSIKVTSVAALATFTLQKVLTPVFLAKFALPAAVTALCTPSIIALSCAALALATLGICYFTSGKSAPVAPHKSAAPVDPYKSAPVAPQTPRTPQQVAHNTFIQFIRGKEITDDFYAGSKDLFSKATRQIIEAIEITEDTTPETLKEAIFNALVKVELDDGIKAQLKKNLREKVSELYNPEAEDFEEVLAKETAYFANNIILRGVAPVVSQHFLVASIPGASQAASQKDIDKMQLFIQASVLIQKGFNAAVGKAVTYDLTTQPETLQETYASFLKAMI